MPPSLYNPVASDPRGLDPTKYSYSYPRDLDLTPKSKLHDKIIKEVCRRVTDSQQIMRSRYPSWRKIDESLTAYVPLDDAEKLLKQKDRRKPVSVVVPMSYVTRETLLTYLVVAFLQDPIFRYEGTGPEDVVGAILLENVIKIQCNRFRTGLALHTQWMDALSYGFGVVAPRWETIKTKRRKMEDEIGVDPETLEPTVIGKKKGVKTVVEFEGNDLINIDPYMYVPDPSVPIHQPQKGEFVGWLEKTNRMALLEQEQDKDSGLFNCKYLRDIAGKSQYITHDQERDRVFGGDTRLYSGGRDSSTNPVDVINLYVKLIPDDWGLSTKEEPEIWLFRVAADTVVISAQPLNLDHQMYPISVCAPDYDGYSLTPLSRLEIIYGLQTTMDWLFSSHVANVRKAINDVFIIDPSLVNMEDLKDPGPGMRIRLRRSAWGRGVKDAVMQLPVTDVTKNHISDTSYITSMIQRVTGAVDSTQGFIQRSGERVSAQESRDSRSSALSRIEKAAKIISMQSMQELGYMFASHTQQLMSEEVFARLTGDYAKQLRDEYGLPVRKDGRLLIKPEELLVDFDVIPHDGTTGGSEHMDTWVNLFQIMATNPLVGERFDIQRVFQHIARLGGAKNLDDFIKQTPIQTTVASDQAVQQAAQAGNIVPVGAL